MWYDLVVLGILGYGVVRGASKGFIWQIASIAGLLLCFVFAETLSPVVSPYIGLKPPLNRWVAMLGIYLAFSFGAFALARLLHSWIEAARLKEYDQHLGALFGFIKGAVFCLVATFFVVTLSEQARGYVFHSYSGHAAALVMDRLHPVMPAELHEVLEPYIHQLDRPGMDLQHARHDDHGHHHSESGDLDHEEKHGHHHSQHTAGGHDEGESEQPSIVPFDFGSAGEQEWMQFINTLVEGTPDGSLRDLIRTALENTESENRSVLLQKLSSAEAAATRSIALQWQQGKPAEDGSSERKEMLELLKEIAALYSDHPEARDSIVEEVELSLTGLPDEVSLLIVQDWYSDLMGLDEDPDPETNMTTSLDKRILRQMAQARIPLTVLSSRMQDRLRESLPR